MNRETAKVLRGLIADHRIVSITGSGGKTTLLCFLSALYRDEKVLATTSTRIRMPVNFPFCADLSACRKVWESGEEPGPSSRPCGVAFSGAVLSGKHAGKLGNLPDASRVMLFPAADRVFIEADGSRGLPLKCAAPWEPVILPGTELVLCVAGLSALGKPLGEVCYRCPAGREQEIVTEGTVADLLASEKAAAERAAASSRVSFFAVLNQCDDGRLRSRAEEILGILREKHRISGIHTSFTEEERKKYC